ncbi:acyltransferase [Endozoicomonas sp. SCSIO W0465]|uniref:acyltransferase n=1 Tax=Endozoicomonas sp. SCSIO W0465 TaxID=2918516 RepID=UPI002074F947|nr:acyltransferase [Endozoicomonas sp. SCSIO W0465]USE34542.1 acyltransferase [Endozoicomonas sp. SCSIO W0465]
MTSGTSTANTDAGLVLRDSPVSGRQNYFFIELLRCVAAIAVVVIHVLGPYRNLDVGSGNWLVAIGFNVISRWAVPVFIMVTGALMLADTRPFNLRYYLTHRCSKVLVPFAVWSLGYALLAGINLSHDFAFTYDFSETQTLLGGVLEDPTWYHLGFYYYFLPLYLVIPFLTPVAQKLSDAQLWMLVFGWLILTLLYFFRVDSVWMTGVIMYGGYLVFGYALRRAPLDRLQCFVLVGLGVSALVSAVVGIWMLSTDAGAYAPGRFTSYKTINTVLVAGAFFALACRYADVVSGKGRQLVSLISRYSLGLYLIHPLLLWPLREFDFYPTPSILAIPLITAVVTLLSLILVRLLARCHLTAWLVP